MKERVETQHILLKNIAAERDRLKAINADLLAALEDIEEWALDRNTTGQSAAQRMVSILQICRDTMAAADLKRAKAKEG